MVTIRDEANIYLIPASSAEDESLIKKSLETPGLDRSDIDDLEFAVAKGQSNLGEFARNSEAINQIFNKRKQYKRGEITKSELQGIIEDKFPELAKLRDESQNEYQEMQKSVHTKGDKPVSCWPIDQETGNQFDFSSGDLVLFYTGNNFYKFAGIVDSTHQLDSLGKLLVGDPNRGRSFFLALSEVHRVQIDSSVIAKLTGRDLDSVQKVSPLSGQARDELVHRYGSLSEFISEARSGINTLLSPPEQDTSDVWNFDESQSQDTQTANAETTTVNTTATQSKSPDSTNKDSIGTSESTAQKGTGLKENIGKSKPEWKDLAQQLKQSKQIVLVGAQGTGKRQLVSELLSNWIDERGRIKKDDRISRTQFTPSTDYSGFVLGHFGEQPRDTDLVRGPFGQFIDIAAAEASQFIAQDYESPPKYVMVIEGFDKVNPAEVFGEFYQALHPRNRGPDNIINVHGATASLWIPEEVYIIGIADTVEMPSEKFGNGIGSPFAVKQTMPDYETLYELYGYSETEVVSAAQAGELDAKSILALEELNRFMETSEQFSKKDLIGHMYLSKSGNQLEAYDTTEIQTAWQYEIVPTLAGFDKDTLVELQDEFLNDVTDGDKPLTVGAVQSDSALSEEIIDSLAQSHWKY